MTNPLEPNDLSHLSDEEFMALCPQGFHGTGDFDASSPSPKPKTTVAALDNVTSLWGGRTADEGSDPWNVTSGGGLPELPGQYGTAPELSDEPF